MKYVVFDFDGVFGDSWEATVATYMKMAHKTDKDAVVHYLQSDRLYNPRYTKDRVYSDSEVEELMLFRKQEYELKKAYGTAYFDDFIAEVKRHQNQLTCAIVSTAYQQALDEFVEYSQLSFTHILGFSPRFSKEYSVEKIAHDWGVSLADIYFVTDTVRDIKEMKTILQPQHILGCSWGFQGKTYLEKELPAEQILDSAEDFTNILEL